MSYQGILRNLPGAVAAEDLTAHQFRFVKVTAENAVSKCTVAGEVVDGVLENKANTGQPAVVSVSGSTKVELGDTVSAGELVMTDSSGRAVPADGSAFVVGRAIESGTVGGRVPVKLKPQGFGISPVSMSETFADMDIYVDGTSGSDTTGDGSASAPFATFTKAFSVVPYVVKHVVTIRPTAGTYTDWPDLIAHRFDGGTIVVDASGLTPTTLSGPHTIAAVTPLTQQAWSWMYFGNDIQASGSPGWTPDAYRGKFALFANGPRANEMSAIFYNDTDEIRVGIDGGSPWQVGNTFSIVEQAVTISTNKRMHIRGEWSSKPFLGLGLGYGAQFVIAGIKFTSSYASRSAYVLENIDIRTPFCSFVDTAFGSGTVEISTSYWNLAGPTGLLDQSGLEGSYSLATYVETDTLGNRSVQSWDSNLKLITTRDQIFTLGKATDITHCMCGECIVARADYAYLDTLYVEQQGYNGGGLNTEDGYMILYYAWVERGAQAANTPAMKVEGPATIYSYSLKGNASGLGAGNYSLEVGRDGHFILKDGNTDILAPAGAIKFPFGGTTHATWPGAGVSWNDTAGSYVTRE